MAEYVLVIADDREALYIDGLRHKHPSSMIELSDILSEMASGEIPPCTSFEVFEVCDEDVVIEFHNNLSNFEFVED